jgi:tetratricopeptide (TPR) repeat protein
MIIKRNKPPSDDVKSAKPSPPARGGYCKKFLPRKSYSRESQRLWLVIIGWSLLSFSSCRSSDKTVSKDLTPPQSLTETLPPGQTQTYQFAAPTQQLFQVSIVHTSARLKLKLSDTKGNLIREMESLDYGPTPLSLISAKAETYQLEASSAEPANTTPLTYRLQVAEPRLVSQSDVNKLEAEEAFAEGNRLARNGDVKSVRAAIVQFQKAQSVWENFGETRNLALVQKSLGQAYSYLYENVTAQTHALRALDYIKRLNDDQLKAGILNDLCLIEVNLSENEKAQQHGTQALEISQKNQFRIEEAAAFYNLGEVYYAFGDRQRSLDSMQQALQCWSNIQNRRGLAQTYLNIGYIYNDWRQIDQARNYFHQALQLWNSISDKRGQALTLMAIGNVHARIGENQETLKFYDQALPGLEQTGARLWEASILLNSGFIHHSYGNYDRALELYEKARQIQHDIRNIENEAGALFMIGWIHQLKNEPQKALTYLNNALSLCEEISEKKYASHIIRKIGDVYLSTGESATAYKYYHQALLRHREGGEKPGEADALNSLGQLHFQSGKKQKALVFFEASLSINRAIGARFAEAQNLYNLARLAKSQNNFAAANDRILEAIKVIESLRSAIINQQLRTSYFAVVHQIFQLSIDIWMQQQTRPDQFAKESFTISEQSRARSLFDLLNESRRSIKQGVSPQLLEKERALQQSLNLKADRKLKIAGQTNQEAELAALTKEIDDLTNQLNEVYSKIRETSPRYAALTQPQPLKAAQIQQLLDNDTMLLEYSLGDQRSYIWAVTRNSIEAYTLPNRATIESLVREVYQLMIASPQKEGETARQWHQRVMQADQQYWPRAATLSQMILGPVADKLANKQLVIVADGALQLLPFAALPVPEARSQKSEVRRRIPKTLASRLPTPDSQIPLIADHEITYLPSASTLQMLRQDRAKPEPPDNWLARWSRSIHSWLGQTTPPASLYSVAVLAIQYLARKTSG